MVTNNIYASDLDPEKRTDAFMGKGFEDLLKKAKEEGSELIVGLYCDNSEWMID